MIIFVFIIFSLIMLSFVLIACYIANDRSFDKCVSIERRIATTNGDNHLKIGIVGDSWVAGKKMDQALLDAMTEDSKLKIEVVSSGQPGAVTRQIYRNLTSEEIGPYSCRNILMDENIDYIVVVAGANDTVEHIGRYFYAHHMLCIIKAIQARGIHPVIVETPEYGIEITPPKSFLNYSKRLIYRILFDGNKHDVIVAYRRALLENLTPEILRNLSIIDFSMLSTNYDQNIELYENPNHLNEQGTKILANLISKAIFERHNKIEIK